MIERRMGEPGRSIVQRNSKRSEDCMADTVSPRSWTREGFLGDFAVTLRAAELMETSLFHPLRPGDSAASAE
jgi:hypothetical protein